MAEKVDFAAKLAELKKDLGIETKSRASSDSKFGVVKRVLMEENTCKEEAIFKIMSELREKGVDVKASQKSIMSLISNLLTYVRKGYVGYEQYKLVDTNGQFQIVSKTE